MSTTTTITLSERPPVTIIKADWPIVAEARDHDGQVECQANTEWHIRVRQHADGRAIVYGSKEAGNGGQHIHWRGARGGFLLETKRPMNDREISDEITRAIRRVAGIIERDDLGDDCIADLPAVELT